jgi:hypothetical protein
MSTRDAILVGNSVAYQDKSKNITKQVVERSIADLSKQLMGLGEEFSFSTTEILDRPNESARRAVLSAIKATHQKQKDLLLFYYFGHGIKPVDRDALCLFFNNSNPADQTTMLSFSTIAEWLGNFRIPKAVIMLDCCYAGAVRDEVHLLHGYKGSYFVMAAATPKEKARADYEDEQPFGVFSKFLLNAFNNPRVRSLGRDVTFRSFYNYLEQQTRKASHQHPYHIDLNLGNDVFFKQTTEPVIASEVRDAPKKSSYKKLFRIGSVLLLREFRTPDALYTFLKVRNFEEFLQPYKTAPRQVEYRFVSEAAFHNYLYLAQLLGIIDRNEPVRLTARGKTMMRNEGRRFNEGLHGALRELWLEHGLTFLDLEDAISLRMHNRSIPTVDAIFYDMRLGTRIRMSRTLFKILLDLTGFVGALKYAQEKTFFPAVSED